MINSADEQKNSQTCIIWLHGLGSSSEDLGVIGTEPPFSTLPIQNVFLDAPKRPVTVNNGLVMPAWYDIYGFSESQKEDKEGIIASSQLIKKAIDEQIDKGFKANHIFLAGFSQGGAMALYTGLTLDKPLAGIISLSGYLPIASEIEAELPTETHFFLGSGRFDHIVLPAWTKQAANFINDLGYKRIVLNEYPMEHSICLEEIQDLAIWVMRVIKGELP